MFAVDFEKQIKPLLESRCISCHGAKKDKGDLRLDTLEHALKGGEGGPAIVLGNPAKSLLIEKIILPHDHDDIMPPKGKPLSKLQIGHLQEWIKSGSKWPKGLSLKSITKAKTPQKKIDTEKFKKLQRYRLLVADGSKQRIAIINKQGEIEWEHKIRQIHDLQYLANGNVLFQTSFHHLIEIDPTTNKTIWSYDSGKMNGNAGKRVEVHAFQRLKNGLTMIAESGPARIIEVDNNGKIVKNIKLKVNKPHPHTDTRLARKLANGHYLVSHEGDGFVREYDPNGNVTWEYEVPMFDKSLIAATAKAPGAIKPLLVCA